MPVVAQYRYENANGELQYTINRTHDKVFFPSTPTETPYDEITRIPYNLVNVTSELLTGGTIWVVESEKSADLLNSLGFVATCSAGGAAWPWPKEWIDHFKGASQIFVCADNDQIGVEAANKRAKLLTLICNDVRVLEFPDLNPKDDVWDWMQTHTVDDLWKKAEYSAKISFVKPSFKLNSEGAILSYLMRPMVDKMYIINNLSASDFTDMFYRAAYSAITLMMKQGLDPNPQSLAVRMLQNKLLDDTQEVIESKLWDLVENTEYYTDTYKTWVDDILQQSTRRSVEDAAKHVLGSLRDTSSPDSLLESWKHAGTLIRQKLVTCDPPPTPDDFMAFDTAYNWIIPDLLEARDRTMLVGKEGHGKSTLIRQWAVMCAAGIHWFDLYNKRYGGLRTLIIDRENSPNQVRRGLGLTIGAADKLVGDKWHSNLFVEPQASALNLLDPVDRMWVESKIMSCKPDVVILAPLYKLFNDEFGKSQELNAQTVAKIIDDWRDKYGCAIIVEAHAGHGDGNTREYRPTGSSVWLRWPEIRVGLKPTDIKGAYEVKHFGGLRNDVYFPKYMFWNTTGNGFPWLHGDSLEEEDVY